MENNMLRISNIKLRADFDPSKEQELLARKIKKILKGQTGQNIVFFSISKKSIDAKGKK
ncbi:hypothetical protein KHA80_06660 [Anaerobacillus sp. HL2]|nr:hypothetical protein KHA80_06660 [Anaerobacillus sp. HL2]